MLVMGVILENRSDRRRAIDVLNSEGEVYYIASTGNGLLVFDRAPALLKANGISFMVLTQRHIVGRPDDLPRERGAGIFALLADGIGPALMLFRQRIDMKRRQLARRLVELLAVRTLPKLYIARVECSEIGLTLDRFVAWCEALECRASDVLRYAEYFAENKDRPEEELIEEAL